MANTKKKAYVILGIVISSLLLVSLFMGGVFNSIVFNGRSYGSVNTVLPFDYSERKNMYVEDCSLGTSPGYCLDIRYPVFNAETVLQNHFKWSYSTPGTDGLYGWEFLVNYECGGTSARGDETYNNGFYYQISDIPITMSCGESKCSGFTQKLSTGSGRIRISTDSLKQMNLGNAKTIYIGIACQVSKQVDAFAGPVAYGSITDWTQFNPDLLYDCRAEADCKAISAGYTCIANKCKAVCSSENDCSASQNCVNNECVPDPCYGITCEDKCNNNIYFGSGKCEAGKCVYSESTCSSGCMTDEPKCIGGSNGIIVTSIIIAVIIIATISVVWYLYKKKN